MSKLKSYKIFGFMITIIWYITFINGHSVPIGLPEYDMRTYNDDTDETRDYRSLDCW